MRISLISILFTLLPFASSAQQHSIDSLTARLNSVAADNTVRVDILNDLSVEYQRVDYSQALKFAEEAVALASKLNYQKGLAVANNRRANCNLIMGNSDQSIDQALVSSVIAEKEGLTDVLAESYRILGISYQDIDRPKAQASLLKAESLALQINDKMTLTKIYTALGVLKSFLSSYDSANAYFDQALSIARELKFDLIIPLILSNQLNSVAREGIVSKEDIRKKCQEIIDLSTDKANRFGLCLGYMRMGEYHHKYGDYAKSNDYHQKSIEIAQAMKLRTLLKANYFSMIALLVEKGDFWGAHGYMKKYYEVKEELMNEKKTRQIVELETRYETEKKEATIQLLEREQQIQAIWKYVWISGSIFVIIVVLIIYRLQVQKNKKSEELLHAQRTLNAKLKETDQLKSRFFANLSHEFRTPLSLIIAPLEEQMRKATANNADVGNMVLIRRNANRLLDMVNELLDLSKLEAKKMKLSIREGQLREFLNILVSSFESLAEHKNITTIVNLDLPSRITWFDSDKIEKVINNLLSNACKFTPPGGTVTFNASIPPNGSMVVISVKDTGPGIPADDQQFLFSPFFQSSANREAPILPGQVDTRGTGLGLALVKELIELHKGSVSVESEPGNGTTFTVRFPVTKNSFSAEDISANEVPVAMPVRGIEDKVNSDELETTEVTQSMLIVEDNGDLSEFISSVFRDKYSITTARNGKEGLQYAITHHPDIIISDVMMPEMDGFTMLQKVREDERINHIPVILLTALNESESRLKGFRSRTDDYLSKPFSTEELRARVDNLVEQRKLLAVKYRERFITAATPIVAESVDEVFIKKVVGSIEEQLGDPSFSVEKLAEKVNLSRAQLFRKLKALMNVSPNQLINDIRLQRASELIRMGADTLSQISYRVGFNEPSYFARRFRQKYGVTPSEFADRE